MRELHRLCTRYESTWVDDIQAKTATDGLDSHLISIRGGYSVRAYLSDYIAREQLSRRSGSECSGYEDESE